MQAYRVVVAGSVLVSALLGVSMPAVASEFNGIEPRDFSTVCTHDSSVNPPFSDVGVPHNIAVNCAARFDLVKGVGDGLYHPWAPLRRDQAATVVRNWLETAFGFALPDETDHPFTDLDGNVHAGAIALLTDIGIVGGVTLVHLNDSRDPAGSGRDRHASLGDGDIDPTVLCEIVRLCDTDTVLETPGGVEEHRADLTWIRQRLGLA
jgi:hypothetical protein